MFNKPNLKAAKRGDLVKFRCGGSARIKEISPSVRFAEGGFFVTFAGTGKSGAHYNSYGSQYGHEMGLPLPTSPFSVIAVVAKKKNK